MWKYVGRRFLYMLITIWGISIIAFGVIQLPPGDYISDMVARMTASGAKDIPPDFEARMREQYGLNEPMHIQYFKWIGNILFKGDFGYSFNYKRDASAIIMERLPMSFGLSLFSFLFIWIVALPIGVYSAVKKYSIFDYSMTFIGFIGLAIPNFLLALLCLFISYKVFNQASIGLFSAEYADAPWSWAKAADLFRHLWIPVIIVGLGGTAGLIRTMRANLLDELNKPYVNTARAKGLSERDLLVKYPLRHAMNPFVSTIGWLLPGLVSGEAIVSIVLNLPTAGPILLEAQKAQDLYLAAGFTLLLSVLTVVGTFISDLLLAWLDPRIRLEA